MSIVARFTPKSATLEQYNESIRRLEDAGLLPPDGHEYHIVFGTDGNLRVSEIWDSPEQLRAFGDKLMPILSDLGIELDGEPEILEVHNIIRR